MRPSMAGVFSVAILAVCVIEPSIAASQAPPTDPTAAEIVAQMQRHNLLRKEQLKSYKSLRVYEVEYRGFAAHLMAKMEVEVAFDAAAGKTFRIVSEGGSSLLREKVLKRAVESEKEAARDEASTALTEANYRFQFLGRDTVAGRTAFILHVDPIKPSKFLYRGKIWIDSADFAVVKMETEPAKNPSIWITSTHIHFVSANAEGFWLPGFMRSETRVVVGGTATLTINYGTYGIVSTKDGPATASIQKD